MMSDSENQLSEEQINVLVEALPHALHPVDRDIKDALVRKGYRALKHFPNSAESPRWNDLKKDCRFNNAQRNEVIDVLFPHQAQPTGK
jgi:hypothetical protein